MTLLIEPFYGGSHKELLDTIQNNLDFKKLKCITMSAKKWHWRARTAALHVAEQLLSEDLDYSVVFATSTLNLAELLALVPTLGKARKIIYFHENQLVYPVRKSQERDFQFGYNQILSCLVADLVLFNSEYNMNSFLESINTFLNLMPDYRPRNVAAKIRPKCQVLYFPVNFPELPNSSQRDAQCLHIVWPHRWEHDKNPELVIRVLLELFDQNFQFRISILGEQFEEIPEVFNEAKQKLASRIEHWGFLEPKAQYYAVLQKAHVALSTANHEFFGVAMLEAAYCGCYPVCPKRLVYPEIFPPECLYSTEQQLRKMLIKFCTNPPLAVQKRNQIWIEFDKFSWPKLKDAYSKLLC